MNKKPRARLIQSLDRALNILDVLADRDGSVGLTELASDMGLDSSTVYRLLATLRAHRYVQQDERDRRYSLGPKAIELGQKALGKFTLRSKGAPFVRELASKTGETAHLASMVGGHPVYVDKRVGSGPLTVSAQIGGFALPYCTATTAKTITDVGVLKEHLKQVRTQGYALDDEEYHPGIRCLGVPIFDHSGLVVGSLGISASVSSLAGDRMTSCITTLKDVGRRLSSAMGYVEGDE
jgi:IclR family KDG regulon transcriptional repressor